MDNNKKDFKPDDVPEWWDCTWHRYPCWKDNCPVCGKIKQKRKERIERGENPESLDSLFEDINDNLDEAKEVVKKDMNSHNIEVEDVEEKEMDDFPEPEEEFSLQAKVASWCKDVYSVARESGETDSSWLETEQGKDLLWYTNTLLTKTYRQLCNRRDMDKNRSDSDAAEWDYNYHQYVLMECISILVDSLEELEMMDLPQKYKFRLALLFLHNFKNEVIEI